MGSPFAPRPPSSGFGIHRNPTAPVPLPLHLEPTSPGTPSGIVSVLDDMTSRSVDTRTYGPGEILITDDNGHLTALPAAPIKDSPLLKFIDGHPHWSKTFDGDYVFGKITATTLISSTLALDDLTLNVGGSFTLTGWAAGSIGYINGSAAFTQLAAGVGAANKLLQHGPAGAMPQWTDLNLLVAGTTNQVTVGDNGDGSLTLSLPQDLDTGADLRIGSLGVGVAATGAAGDATFGASGGAQLTYDRSATTLKLSNAGGATYNTISSAGGTKTQFNQGNDDIDHQFGSLTNASLMYLDAGLATIGIGAVGQSNAQLYVDRTWAHTSGQRYGFNAFIANDPAGASTGTTVALRGLATHRTAQNMTAVIGVQGVAQTTAGFSANTLTSLIGLQFSMTHGGAGAISDAVAIDLPAPSITGSTPGVYAGIRMSDPGSGAGSTIIGYWQLGTNAHNRFNGDTMIGASSAPTETLSVTGTCNITNSLGVGVAATGAAGDAKFGDSSTYMFWDKSTSIFKITGESAGASDGPDLLIKNNSASQQDSDRAGSISFYGSDSGGAEQLYGRMRVNIIDVTAATEDSNIEFQVAQAGSLIVASLSNAGVWTDASSASLKTYEGSLRFGALETVAMLDTGVYRGHKRGSEQHISPTAEQWRTVTGLRGTPAGIAPKDLAGLALLAIVELQDEVRALRAQIRST